MENDSRNLARFWCAKTDEILNCSHMSVAKKILAYKVFMRPILIYNWFEGCHDQLKALEIQTLKRIFPAIEEDCLYECYTDIDVSKYLKIQEIRWKRKTRSQPNTLRRMLRTLSKTLADPSPYFTRAINKQKHCCHEQFYALTPIEDSDISPTTPVRRSRRLADKKRIQFSRR